MQAALGALSPEPPTGQGGVAHPRGALRRVNIMHGRLRQPVTQASSFQKFQNQKPASRKNGHSGGRLTLHLVQAY